MSKKDKPREIKKKLAAVTKQIAICRKLAIELEIKVQLVAIAMGHIHGN